ncbi:MAG: glycosyltransferase family 9 protein [bacterium]|nr:glycosyltransferase family 9 protein [bacterium]
MTRRLRNLCIFIAAYIVVLFGRRPSIQAPERILLVPAGKLGDVVCTTPVMRAVRTHLPHAKLYIREYGNINSALLADSGLADGYIKTGTVREYVKALRRERIDTVLLTGPSLEDVAAALIARVPRIIAPRVLGGYCPQQTRPYLWLLRFIQTFPYGMEAYAPRERLRVLEPLGIYTGDTIKHLGFSDSARASVAMFLSEHGIVGRSFATISPSAGNKIKNWPADRFARVAEHIVAMEMPVIIIGSKRDKEEVRAVMAALKDSSHIIDASERLSLDELKALIAGAALFVSVDTGPLYIAEAFGVPTVDIVGPVDERVQPPRGPRHTVVVPPRDRPQLYIMNARMYDEVEARRQTESISVEHVCTAIDTLMHTVKRRQRS